MQLPKMSFFRTLAFCLALMSAPTVLAAQGGDDTKAAAEGGKTSTGQEQEQSEKAQKEAGKQRGEIIKEAVTALNKTKSALVALEKENTEDALSDLVEAEKNLDTVLSESPELKLAPVDVSVTRYDVQAGPEAVREMVNQAEEDLEAGNVQQARTLLSGLASEIVITEANLPLASYPDAIKEVSPLIVEGKTEEAKRRLQTALNTIVLQDTVIPLPVVRATDQIEEAEKLAQKDELSSEKSDKLADHLADARAQIELAQALGYGEESEYEQLYNQLDKLEKKTAKGESGSDWFEEFKQSLSQLWS